MPQPAGACQFLIGKPTAGWPLRGGRGAKKAKKINE